MPLGNYTSQFFANVYLNRLDHFIKHQLKAKYYIRYVDDFIIFNRDKKELQEYKSKISNYLSKIKLSLHKDKSKIIPLKNGISFLGLRIFYFNKLLKKRNLKHLIRRIELLSSIEEVSKIISGWFGYAKEANTYNLRKYLTNQLLIPNPSSTSPSNYP